jgi:hypothetical protein
VLRTIGLLLASLFVIEGLKDPALGQGGSIGASTAAPECRASLEITSVKSLGKADKTDRFLVEWTTSGPESRCLRFFTFDVSLSITRKRGHVDSGSVKDVPGTSRKATVEIPRGTVETDAASFKASLTGRMTGSGEQTIELKGKGSPVLAARSASQPGGGARQGCAPSLRFEKVNFFPNQGGKDVIGLFWNADANTPCLSFTSANATVRITRVDGRVENKTVPGSLGSSVQTANVEFPAGAAIDSYEIRVRAETKLVSTAQRFDTQKSGTFAK